MVVGRSERIEKKFKKGKVIHGSNTCVEIVIYVVNCGLGPTLMHRTVYTTNTYFA